MAPALPDLAARIAADGRPKYQVAAEAGVHPNVLAGLISGRVEPTADVLGRIAGVLGTTADQLTGGAK
jgi:transcriptional regulator with XRE-family HTH domain